jgi:uncharacterized protein YbjT (DUF2867 family)
MPSVTLLGATGLVGSHCLDILSRDTAFTRIIVLARRKFGEATAPRVEAHIVDFTRLEEQPQLFRVDQVICAVGTTIRAAGSQARFREVDYDIPVTAARTAAAQGARHFLLVSSIGADAGSRFFYSRVKGEVEDALRKMPFRSITIVRPSLLLGERPEFRLGERLLRPLAPLVPGRYAPVHARDVALVLARCAREDVPGLSIVESDEIRSLARESRES